ncbi:Putative peptidase S33 tripeptidyl aminopeptidase-like, alpha/Beta hydrolase [Septoria linicola]|uniref:Peptidase S33 tripeptidyl aminopeptidase-like, alpha/Beta hydrolase n=1 Tax=Septoria linicola TaxID=215465 RepID=A0A9Q9EFG6_9PEZI|nr:putative peptidase S33 tripeptidyl aminopeptidase-like, alpha/Beta hydrolase [Septoria linicola]USW47208.1 Putative peptidase S33 tripeptidyl aminopeptidase-like, alpha/Beta hydrolase [Septoria linicola]
MEKQVQLVDVHSRFGPTNGNRRPLKLICTAVLVCFAILNINSRQARLPNIFRSRIIAGSCSASFQDVFDWASISASTSLQYTPCYKTSVEEFQCARLTLPMDYWNHTTDATISLAVIRRPATVPVTDPRYGGAVLLNPGGPGGSGIGLVVGSGRSISEIIDGGEAEGKSFDLLSFDPRGVGETLPVARCMTDQHWARVWELRTMTEGILGSSDASLGRLWSMARARSKSCSLPPTNSAGEERAADIKQYVSTAYVARDMLELVEKHGEWREAEAGRLSGSMGVLEKLKYRPGEEKIMYWGFSYGSYLGMTFAALFPRRISRLIVDGVVDAVDYTKALWFDNLMDTERDVDTLYYHCARVGHPRCALANENGTTTPKQVKQRVENITQSLHHNPLPVISASQPDVIEYSDIHNLIFGAVSMVLDTPVWAFPFVADMIADIGEGNGTRFAQILKPRHSISYSASLEQFGTSGNSKVSVKAGPGGNDALLAIACSDGDPLKGVSFSEFSDFTKNLTSISPSIGPMWATIRLQCIHYSIRPQHRYPGPWEGNTSHPLLFIGNTEDPVTPLRNAFKHSKGFVGSAVLTQRSPGHCSSAAHSACTESYIRAYFQNGSLPDENTLCEVDEVPFGDADAIVSEAIRSGSERARNIAESLGAVGGIMGLVRYRY